MPTSSHLLTLVVSLLLTDSILRFSQVLLAQVHMTNATFALWVSLSFLYLPFFSSASRSRNILSWNKFSTFYLLFLWMMWGKYLLFNTLATSQSFFLSSELWEYLAEQGCWDISVGMTHPSPLGTSPAAQGAEICDLKLKDNTSISILTTHWVLEIICISPILILCHNSINIPIKSIRKIHSLIALNENAACFLLKVTNSSINQWKMRSLYQHTWRQKGIRVLSIIKNV